MESFEENVILIDAFDDVEFDSVARKCVDILNGKKKEREVTLEI